jgi:hypothetical protein
MVTAQVPVPVQAPDQPVKSDPVSGVAVRVTAVPSRNDAVQLAPQLIPAGLLVTVPAPVPVLLTSRAKLRLPVPVSDTVVGLPTALCAIDTLALFAPMLAGVNVRLTVQLPLGATDAPQVVVRANCDASAPVTVIAAAPPPGNTRSVVPVLLIVTVCDALVVDKS